MTTATYTALLSLLFIYLSIRTLILRRNAKIPVGVGKSPELLRAIRAHGNFAEYVPLTLFALYLVEQTGINTYFIHALGMILLTGRLAHAYGISHIDEDFKYRIFGMACTFTTLATSALILLYRSLNA